MIKKVRLTEMLCNQPQEEEEGDDDDDNYGKN